MVSRRYGRPVRADLFLMMLVNAIVALVALAVTYLLFGVSSLIPTKLALMTGHTLANPKLMLLAFMLPGAGIGYGCLWYWLVITGRSRGINWGAAIVYGAFIAYANLPVTGFLLGLMYGDPMLFALVALALLCVVPPLLAGTTAFALLMALFNGVIARRWIEYHRVK